MDNPRIRVNLTTLDGEVLDQFELEPMARPQAPSTPEGLAQDVRDMLEHKYEVKE